MTTTTQEYVATHGWPVHNRDDKIIAVIVPDLEATPKTVVTDLTEEFGRSATVNRSELAQWRISIDDLDFTTED